MCTFVRCAFAASIAVIAAGGLVGAASSGVTVAQNGQVAKGNPASSASAPTSKLLDISWFNSMAGAWQGEVQGSVVEEIWSRPRGNTIMGCFRWCKPDGDPVMLEMLAITRESDAVRLRLRHYTPALNAKEEKDKPLTLKLEVLTETKATFVAEKDANELASISYDVQGDTLRIEVAFAQPNDTKDAGDHGGATAKREPLKFELKRQ